MGKHGLNYGLTMSYTVKLGLNSVIYQINNGQGVTDRGAKR